MDIVAVEVKSRNCSSGENHVFLRFSFGFLSHTIYSISLLEEKYSRCKGYRRREWTRRN